jgi:glycosyltransferase involved in cell wall biosynthesis
MRVCLTPRHGGGGPASFQGRLQAEFDRLGVETTFDPRDRPLDAVLVFAGTKDLPALSACRRSGVRIVQRLDGINWLHRRRPGSPFRFLRAELLNWQLRLIRSVFADRIVYQSDFTRDLWQTRFGAVPGARQRVIRNGVALDEYPAQRGGHDGTLLAVEGTLDFNAPAAAMVRAANESIVRAGMLRRLSIYTRILPPWIPFWEGLEPPPETPGMRPRGEVRARQAQAALFLTLELNPPCPNAVIEALASGLPVIGYDTGSAGELVGEGGELAEFGGDPWRLDVPRNLDALARLADRVLKDWSAYSRKARRRAEAHFDIRRAAQSYLEVLAE